MTRFILKLSDYTLRKLIEAGRAVDVTPGRMAETMLDAWMRDEGARPDRAPPGVDEPTRAWAGATDEGVGSDPRTTPQESDGLIVELAEPLRSRLADMARARGVTPEALAAEVLDDRLFDYDDFEWPEGGDPREDNAANYDLNEVGRPWSEVRPEFVALIDRTFGKPE